MASTNQIIEKKDFKQHLKNTRWHLNFIVLFSIAMLLVLFVILLILTAFKTINGLDPTVIVAIVGIISAIITAFYANYVKEQSTQNWAQVAELWKLKHEQTSKLIRTYKEMQYLVRTAIVLFSEMDKIKELKSDDTGLDKLERMKMNLSGISEGLRLLYPASFEGKGTLERYLRKFELLGPEETIGLIKEIGAIVGGQYNRCLNESNGVRVTLGLITIDHRRINDQINLLSKVVSYSISFESLEIDKIKDEKTKEKIAHLFEEFKKDKDFATIDLFLRDEIINLQDMLNRELEYTRCGKINQYHEMVDELH